MKHLRLKAASLLWRLGALTLTCAHELERPYVCRTCQEPECSCRVTLVVDGRALAAIRRHG